VATFARRLDEATVLVIVPRFVLALANGCHRPLVPAACWNDTAIRLPGEWGPLRLRDVVTGAVHAVDREISVSALLHDFPVALLINAP
jgi:(1->4)-alpha-D-glucan 1-alpha-D-glucosylmutase